MSELSRRNIIAQQFQVYDEKGDKGIDYYMIIVQYLMVQLSIIANFKRNILEWESDTVPMKELLNMKGDPNITNRKIK